MENKIKYAIMPSKSSISTVRAQIGDEVPFYLHSTVDPYKEAVDWVKRLELTPNTCYVVLGAGLGYHVEALLKQLPEHSHIWLLFTRTEAELLNHTGNMYDEKWLSDKRLSVFYLVNIHDMAVKIADSMINNTIKKVSLCRHFPTMRLAETQYQKIEEELMMAIEQIMALNFNMKVTTEHKFFSNYWKNFSSYALNPGCQLWPKAFAGLPVIIVAAGPSLNKNIAELKRCVDKAVIIAAGSALGALHKHGITPHFLMVTDANPIMYEELKDFFSDETILVVTTSVEPQVVANYPGKKCFFDSWCGYGGVVQKNLPETMWIAQTGSVATAAVDFSYKCGANTIILVGQDLAYEANKHHADGVLAGGFKNWVTVKIPGYYGGEVESGEHFNLIIAYYNQYMKSHSNVDFINATEGGALIKAMRNLPLATVHQQILTTIVDKDKLFANFNHQDGGVRKFKELIGNLQTLFKWSLNLKDQVQEFCDKEQKAISESENPQRAVQQGDIQSVELFFKRIKRRNIYPYIASSVDSWLTLLEFQVGDGMPIDQQYMLYWNIIGDIQQMLVDWMKSLAEAIKVLDNYERGLK